MKPRFLPTLLLLALAACTADAPEAETAAAVPPSTPAALPDSLARATFAGGCFWCMEPPFEKLDGVVSVTSGYTGGTEVRPNYQAVASGRTSHAEAVEIIYEPDRISYDALLAVYWRNVDPTTAERQFCDRGRQYRPAIFYHGDAQAQAARASKAEIEASGRFERVVVAVEPAGAFYPAEDYHQDFYKKNPVRYETYRSGCGRDRRLRRLWGEAGT